MKPNTKSPYFIISILSFGAFFVQLFLLQRYVKNAALNQTSSFSGIPGFVYWLGLFWIGLGCLFYYKTTKFQQTQQRQLLVFILSPIVLSPLLALIYAAVVLLPLYSLAGQPVVK